MMLSMRRRIIMLGVFGLCFLLSMVITSLIINQDSRDMTKEMSAASLPVIYTIEDNQPVNPHYGYVTEMDGNYIRDTISPLDGERTLPIEIRTFGTGVSEVAYEVRSLDMERLVEDHILFGEEYEYDKETGILTAPIHIKDLITPEKEYMLIVRLRLSNGLIPKYYIRFLQKEELGLSEKMAFVRSFSDAAFRRETAEAMELKKYMESNAEGDNSSFGYVNIHSSFDQLTYGTLMPELIGEKQLRILEADRQNGCFMLSFQVSCREERYVVKEFFRIREGAERMYLMEYERTMDQIITKEEELLVNGKLLHGILSRPVETLENGDGSIICFAQEDRLYSFNTQNGNLARIFSFWDENDQDERTFHDEHTICPVSMDEQGNVTFLVYGYMNRGSHEGEEGIAVYYYDSVFNSLEEQLFIPIKSSSAVLDHDMRVLSHMNPAGTFFLYESGTVYRVNVENQSCEIIASGLDEQRFAANDDDDMIAWQPESDISAYATLELMALDSERIVEIRAKEQDLLIPLGFIGDDLVYGELHKSDLSFSPAGDPITPMYALCIVDENGRLLREHSREGYYVMDIEIRGNIINISRAVRQEDGSFQMAEDDQLMSNEKTEATLNHYKSVVTEEWETTWQTVLKKEEVNKTIKVLTPKEVILEDQRTLTLPEEDTLTRYYVYVKGAVEAVHTNEAKAVDLAEEQFGVAVDGNLGYIFEAGDRRLSNTLEGFPEMPGFEEGTSSTAVCLDAMLKYAGIYEDSEAFTGSVNVLSVLAEELPDRQVLNLSGCSLSSVLYYISRGYPVFAYAEPERAVVITGYDNKNVMIFDPAEQKSYKKGMNDAVAWFKGNGDQFISYVE